MSAAKPVGLRVVLDTNVYVSAFTRTQGSPFEIWRQALARRYILVISPAIIIEIARVLRLDFEWEDAPIVERLKMLARVAEIVRPGITLDEIKADSDDNRILECAVEGNADLIVSGDHHLTRLKAFQGIGVIRPIDFLRTLVK